MTTFNLTASDRKLVSAIAATVSNAMDREASDLASIKKDAGKLFAKATTFNDYTALHRAIVDAIALSQPDVKRESIQRKLNRWLESAGIAKPASTSPEAVAKAAQRAEKAATKPVKGKAASAASITQDAPGEERVPEGVERITRALTGNPDLVALVEWALANQPAVRAAMLKAQTPRAKRPDPSLAVYSEGLTGTAH